MKKTTLIIALILSFGISACGTAAPQSTPEPAPDTVTSPAPEPSLSPQASPVVQPETTPVQKISTPSGLRVVYIREGNLWSWTEANGSVQLTDTGDMSTARLSDDGQLLAFMRGREVWTVNMDGTGARLLSTLENDGAALRFAPNNSLLAVSTRDHIDVIDLTNANLTTALTFPAIQDGYYPEVVWSPDASGFKTVIPPETETGQAELLFVFPDGIVAGLAKFSMAPLSESLPYISPDGGYVIYVVRMNGDKASLYLMDSSGATKPYGEPAENIRAYGWLPDSKQFAYGEENLQIASLGNIGGPPREISVAFPSMIRWVDTERYLALENGNLILGDISGARLQIDSTVQDFDFTS